MTACQSVRQSVCLPLCLFVCLSVCQSIVSQSVGRSESHSQNSHSLVNATFLIYSQLPPQPLLPLPTNVTSSSAVVASPLLLPHHRKEGSNLRSNKGSMSRSKAHGTACIPAWVNSQHTSFPLDSTPFDCKFLMSIRCCCLLRLKTMHLKLSNFHSLRPLDTGTFHTHTLPPAANPPAALPPIPPTILPNYEKEGRVYKAARG